MLPNNNLSIRDTKKEFKDFNQTLYNPLVCYEKGGQALGNLTYGLDYQIWYLTYEKGQFILNNEFGFTKLLKDLGNSKIVVTKVSMSFDQNMNCIWGYSYTNTDGKGVVTKNTVVNWFDSSVNNYVELYLDNTFDINIKLDDKRYSSIALSDVILFYIDNVNRLCFRYQRDRYSIEHVFGTLPPGTIVTNLGITEDKRFQLELRTLSNYKHTTKDFLIASI